MNAMFNQVEFIHRLEREGIARGAAEAIAGGIDDGRGDLVTNATLTAELAAMRTELRSAIEIAAAQQIVKLGGIVGGVGALIVAALGLIIAIK